MSPAKKKTPAKTKAPKPPMKVADKSVFKVLSLDLIDDPANPMRTNMTEASVEALVISIKQVGIIEPLVVKPVKRRYEVIAGHRRLFASRLAKLVEVPCYIKHANDEQTAMLKIHENLYRSDINPGDEALHFEHLINKQKMTPPKIAQMISKSLTYVTDRLAILNYPPFLKEAMDKKEVSFSVAREFARFTNLTQMKSAVYYARRGGMTQEMARKWVQDHKRAEASPQIIAEPEGANGEASHEVEHSADCVYCREGLRLIDAEVVYMHTKCLKEANEQVIETTALATPPKDQIAKSPA